MPTPRKRASAPPKRLKGRQRPARAAGRRAVAKPPVPEPLKRDDTGLQDHAIATQDIGLPLGSARIGAAPGGNEDRAPVKPRFELIPPRAEREVAAVFTHGAEKHTERCWKRGVAIDDEIGAALRHISAHRCGVADDHQSGHLHLAHAAARLMIAVERMLSDRFGPVPEAMGAAPQ